MLKKLLILMIGVLGSSGCIDRYRIIHEDLALEPVCVFQKFTESEKDSMTEEVGRKIYHNQQTCRINEEVNTKLVTSHNKAHMN